MENTTTSPHAEADSVGIQSGLVTCSVDELRPHPAYARHNLSVEAPKMATLADLRDIAFQYPLMITRDRLIIDGYGRWELAKREGQPTLCCIEYDLTEEQALQWLIQTHRSSKGLSDFIRIELALDFEPYFREKAHLNERAGGRGKGLSRLTTAERVNSRTEIARIAHVSVGNVHKVKYTLAHACAAVKQAARTKEISINLADKWSHEPEAEQQEQLRCLRIERGLRTKARNLVAAHLMQISVQETENCALKVSDLVTLANELARTAPDQSSELDSIEVNIVGGPGKAIFVTEEAMRMLSPKQQVLAR